MTIPVSKTEIIRIAKIKSVTKHVVLLLLAKIGKFIYAKHRIRKFCKFLHYSFFTRDGVSFPLIIPFELIAIDFMICVMFSKSSVATSSLA